MKKDNKKYQQYLAKLKKLSKERDEAILAVIKKHENKKLAELLADIKKIKN